MNAGKYRHTVIIQLLDDNEEWQEYYTCRAYINGLSGTEFWAARQVQSKNVVEFEMRWCKALAALDAPGAEAIYRIMYEGVPYDIEYADNIMYKNKEIKIRAVKA